MNYKNEIEQIYTALQQSMSMVDEQTYEDMMDECYEIEYILDNEHYDKDSYIRCIELVARAMQHIN